MLISCFYLKKSTVVGALPAYSGGSHSFWKKRKLLVGVGCLGASRKRGGGWSLAQEAKWVRLGRELARPRSPGWNQPSHPKAFKGTACQVREDGAAGTLGTVTVQPIPTVVDSGEPRSPCLGTSCHTHSPDTAISVTSILLTPSPVTPIHLLSYFLSHSLPSQPVTLGTESPPPPSLQLFSPKVTTTISSHVLSW